MNISIFISRFNHFQLKVWLWYKISKLNFIHILQKFHFTKIQRKCLHWQKYLTSKFLISWTHLLWAFCIASKNKDFLRDGADRMQTNLKMVYLFPSYGHLKSMVTYQHKLMTTHPKTCWCICFDFRFSDLISNINLWVTP